MKAERSGTPMKPLVRADLDALRCANPNCTMMPDGHEVLMNAACHRLGVVLAAYTPGSGVMSFYCPECEMVVAHVAVADTFTPPIDVEARAASAEDA